MIYSISDLLIVGAASLALIYGLIVWVPIAWRWYVSEARFCVSQGYDGALIKAIVCFADWVDTMMGRFRR